mmetsp:Transcript_41321/g.54316  ORF Transcript_41321/g.54316 Transcript_41321/m.54316 type:complete len:98 (-) Transcript_41321:2323-2616(-)|eukprot:CAMPEP_0170464890 /NCGR_PEP_ID=MMETSP0123-20130129/9432_1 /TAXON_ID=182087 /ORGANISM="Favella ehrenbergii, Strain Fehren 1" /LENGTH=97 /DNA_ID=CAMNT_0010730635 /DNA_START=1059 /DNA_END=1352 /DNA_ORIENTATION=+
MTPKLQHRSNTGRTTSSAAGGYNPQTTHIRQIKSGLEISGDSQGKMGKGAVESNGDGRVANKENSSLENVQIGGTSANKERAQTAAINKKPPLANHG